MSESPSLPAPIHAGHLERIKQDAMRGIGASSGDTLRLVGELSRYLRDPVVIESSLVNSMFDIAEDLSAGNATLLAENTRLREVAEAQVHTLTEQVAALQSAAKGGRSE